MFDGRRMKRPENDKSSAEPIQQSSRVERRTQHTGDLTRIPLYTQLAWGNQPPPWLRLPIQRRESDNGEPPQQRRENTTGLPDTLKAGVENLSGLSMDDVHVHYNSAEPAQVQALAYTQGTDIHVGPEQEQHLAHEAWHVVQQKQGRVAPTIQARGRAINDDQRLEKEADVMGARAQDLQGTRRPGYKIQSISPGQLPIQRLSDDEAQEFSDWVQDQLESFSLGDEEDEELYAEGIDISMDDSITTLAEAKAAWLDKYREIRQRGHLASLQNEPPA